jgi:DNA-binding NtrC family response regulator
VLTREHIAMSTPQRTPKVVSLAEHGRFAPKQPAEPSAQADEKATHERRRIEEALETCAGNQSRAAKLLGISRATLVARLNLYGFPRPRKRVG